MPADPQPGPLSDVLLATPRSNQRRWLTASLAAHAIVLAALLYTGRIRLTAAERPGDRNGHLTLLTFDPGSSENPAAPLQTTHAKPQKHKAPTPLPAPATPLPSITAPASLTSTADDPSSGNDALGDGDVTLALVIDHASPHPDLSRLAPNTHGDVVIDVVIDATGHISQSKLVRGLGPTVDPTVLAAIQQWTFHPATRNGQPVASEQELLFHYDHA
jgi:protein TonB